MKTVIILLLLIVSSNFSQGWEKTSAVRSGMLTSIYIIQFKNELTGFCAGNMDAVCMTTNGGLSWHDSYKLQYNLTHFIEVKENRIDICVNDNINRASVLLSSSDDGKTWEEKAVFPMLIITGGCFKYTNKLIAGITVSGTSLYTSEDSKAWNKGPQIPSLVNSLTFITESNGYAIGSGLFRSTDKGVSWEKVKVSSDSDSKMETVFFADEMTGFISTNNNKFDKNAIIFKTTDGGASWAEIKLDNMNWFRKIYFVNSSTGYAAGNDKKFNGVIYKTTDGGIIWTKQATPECSILFDISFINEKTGYAGGDKGIVLKTTSGGD